MPKKLQTRFLKFWQWAEIWVFFWVRVAYASEGACTSVRHLYEESEWKISALLLHNWGRRDKWRTDSRSWRDLHFSTYKKMQAYLIWSSGWDLVLILWLFEHSDLLKFPFPKFKLHLLALNITWNSDTECWNVQHWWTVVNYQNYYTVVKFHYIQI